MINIYKHVLSNILHIEGEAGDYCVDMPYITLWGHPTVGFTLAVMLTFACTLLWL